MNPLSISRGKGKDLHSNSEVGNAYGLQNLDIAKQGNNSREGEVYYCSSMEAGKLYIMD